LRAGLFQQLNPGILPVGALYANEAGALQATHSPPLCEPVDTQLGQLGASHHYRLAAAHTVMKQNMVQTLLRVSKAEVSRFISSCTNIFVMPGAPRVC
jgi:hypothetical protein